MSDSLVQKASLAAQAVQAIRSNTLPGLVLWAIASAVVAAYYLVPVARPVFDAVASWKEAGGFAYSIVATAIFAGAIPFLVIRGSWSTFAFLTLFWAWRGFEIDLFYRTQGIWFGNEPTFLTVAAKVAVDLLVYNVVWAANLQLLAYRWKDSGFHFQVFRELDWRDHWTQRLPTALLSTWVVWLPVVTLTYSLPPSLQIPLFNLAACFWSFVMATLTRPKAAPQP